MRLSNLVPEISQELIDALGELGIRTDTDLLLSHSNFELWKQLPRDTITLQQLQDLKRRVQPLCAAEGRSGKDILNLESAVDHQPLRLFLDGNESESPLFSRLQAPSVIEISGNRGSGKTTLALNLVINTLLLSDVNTALWIDTLGDFPMDSMLQAVHSSKVMAKTILDRLQITRSFDIETLHSSLPESHNGPQILVIDTITPLFGPLLSPISSQGHAIMTEFLRNLHNFASTSNCTILVINDTARKGLDRTDRKPALGPSFALMTDTSLWLQKEPHENSSGERVYSVQVIRSRTMRCGPSAPFTIKDGRVCAHKAPWNIEDPMTSIM